MILEGKVNAQRSHACDLQDLWDAERRYGDEFVREHDKTLFRFLQCFQNTNFRNARVIIKSNTRDSKQ